MNHETNPELELAYNYVQYTNQNIFLTGKAGTGKTTFLHKVKKETIKRTVVAAPTGVAAINAGGMTLHSLFQLPFGLFLPNNKEDLSRQRKFTRKKRDLIKSLDLLIIDEISMVRADLLDAVDDVLRRFKNPNAAFGGVQLLMIGDLHQLPPVVKREDWDLLRPHYQTPYFFGSLALQKSSLVTIKLQHIYRQSDSTFIDLLNQVRTNQLNKSVLDLLNSRYIPNFKAPEDEPYIILTSHNRTAQEINQEKLDEIDQPSHIFKAEIEGEFSEKNYPTEEKLELKVGAQVLFIKNDPSFEKRYYNGKIGRIVKIASKEIYVECPNESELISVTTADWENIKYSLNETTKEVKETVIGSFTQYPLKLAWAITIHKSQGLTFERAIIDAQAAFAHGQVYVALSRCKSFEGIVLRSKIDYSSIKTDVEVKTYSKKADEKVPDEAQLRQSKKEYQQDLMRELFRFGRLKKSMEALLRTYMEFESSLSSAALEQVRILVDKTQLAVIDVSIKFQRQLGKYFEDNTLPEENSDLQERIKKASVYFAEKLQTEVQKDLKGISLLTDNQSVRKRVYDQLEEIAREIFIKNACFEEAKNGFQVQAYLTIKTNADLRFEGVKNKTSVEAAETPIPQNTPNPELYQQLIAWRREVAEEKELKKYQILQASSILEIVKVLPTTKTALKKIKGIGKVKVDQFGKDVINLVESYCKDKGISSNVMIALPPSETKQASFDLFKSGKNMDQIAEERNLNRSTIETHLAHFITNGELDIFDVLKPDLVAEIAEYFTKNNSATLVETKSHFGNKYSYGELRMVSKHLERGDQ